MTCRFAVSMIVAAAASLTGCAHGTSSGDIRMDAIRRAQVWTPTDVSAMDLKTGPTGPGAFPVDATVTCDYVDKEMSGRSPKFTCVIPPDDEVKVKYGSDNREVYAEVAGTRLLWALGFGADRMYPVRVVCRGCPSTVGDTAVAAIERKMPGKELESDIETGWAWRELDLVDPEKGGATRAQRDALKLLAAFMQHTDSKAIQQRLVCLGMDKDDPGEVRCEQPFMMISDLGLTFGRAGLVTGGATAGASLKAWAETPIWRDAPRCVAQMSKSMTGTLKHPTISEEGRKFLADLLSRLSDQQLRDLFDVARFALRPMSPDQPAIGTTIGQWVEAFKRKRTEIVDHVCPG